MKTIWLAVVMLFASVMARAQGTISFGTGNLQAVTNGLTGDKVVAGNTFLVALYYAPDGVTNESLLTQLGPTIGFAFPGVFGGGTLTTPTNTPPGGWAMFQVKVWESAYGTTYDDALMAPAQNGRLALVGKSAILRVLTGNEFGFPVPGSLTGYGFRGMTLYPVPEPSTCVLALMGGIALCLAKRKVTT